MLSTEKMLQWINAHRSQWMDEYDAFLRFPTVSADPSSAPAMHACIDWLSRFLLAIDFTVEVWQVEGDTPPILFASCCEAGPMYPTLLLYHHYDVQPIDPLQEWISPPFVPTVRDGAVYARGAQDNKGQCFYSLQAIKLLKELSGTLPINIKLCIEGEEEMGSSSLSRLLPDKREKLCADALAVVDLGLRQAHIPAITLGVRGILTCDVTVTGAASDLHSGYHGGIAPNPIHALVTLLASLRDSNGRVVIPGFYDAVEGLSTSERSAISFSFDAETYTKEVGAPPMGGELNYSPLERVWTRPALEVNGIWGGYTGSGFKTVIPSSAHAKLSCRLVPHQHPQQIGQLIVDYLKQHVPPGLTVAVSLHSGKGEAVRTTSHAPIVRAFQQALEEVFQAPCEFILEGASIPIVAELTRACGGDPILWGLGLSSDSIHAPNEHFGIDRLEKGMCITAQAIQRFAEISPSPT